MVQILSGNFSKTDKANFSGYDAEGTRIFISKAQMTGVGIEKDADVKPFYALIAEREIATRDDKGEITDTMVKRLQATSVFLTEAELFNAKNSAARLAMGAAVDLQKSATAAGLSQTQLDAVLNASI